MADDMRIALEAIARTLSGMHDGDILREGVRMLAHALMEAEAEVTFHGSRVPGGFPSAFWSVMPSLTATLQALVAEQQAMIVHLQERVRDLETRVGQHSGNSSRPPSSDLPDARTGPVRLPGRGLHGEHGRPCRPPAPPRLRLTPGCAGRGRTSHLVRVPK